MQRTSMNKTPSSPRLPREGFEGRCVRDLTDDRLPSEQDPRTYWLERAGTRLFYSNADHVRLVLARRVANLSCETTHG
jgi:hypothetical protein